MRLPQTRQQKIKISIHCLQAALIFIAGCLTLAVMTKDGGFGGQTGFYLALCFFTFPAIVYQTMVPMWSRAWRFNNVYAFAAIDILFTILWFAAAIAVAVWNSNGIAKGNGGPSKSESNADTPSTGRAETKSDGTCASFGYGSKTKCEVSKATTGFGIIISLLFGVTSYVSVRALRRSGIESHANVRSEDHGHEEASIENDPNKDVWSANVDELGSFGVDRPPYGQNSEDDREGLLHGDQGCDTNRPVARLAHPGRKVKYSSSPVAAWPSTYNNDFAPSALSPTSIPSAGLYFPEGDYSKARI